MPPPRFQFSLAALLLTVAVVAGVLALMYRVPVDAARITLVFAVVMLSALSISGVIIGYSGLRMFCVGALVPLAMMLIFIAMNLSGIVSLFAGISKLHQKIGLPYTPSPIESPVIPKLFGVGILLSIALGYLCVGFRWLIGRRQPPDA